MMSDLRLGNSLVLVANRTQVYEKVERKLPHLIGVLPISRSNSDLPQSAGLVHNSLAIWYPV